MGWSVSVYDQYAIAGVPKINALSSSICYLRGSLFQENYCDDNDENALCGQYVLYNKTWLLIVKTYLWFINTNM